MAFVNFGSWSDLEKYISTHAYVHYKAPLDVYPTLVCVTKKFKNGKLRLKYANGAFTVDSSHLDRFCYDASLINYVALTETDDEIDDVDLHEDLHDRDR